MIRKIYISILFFSLTLSLKAQQIGLYSHEFYKPMIINPAFTGNSESTNAMVISRSQWIDFKNSPQMNIFTLDGLIPNKKMGIGIDLYSDRKGISNKIGGDIYYSYRLMLNENTKFTFGIALGIMDHTLHYSEAILENYSDPSLIGTSQRETTINANAGIGFIWKRLEAGISLPQLLGNALTYQDDVYGKAYYAPTAHYQGSLRYKVMLSEDKQLSLTPLVMIHFLPNAPVQYDGNLNLEWKNKFWIGATYKSDYAISANAGFCISKQFYVGYSYDFVIGTIGKYSGMSNELMLNFVFGKDKQHVDEKVQKASLVDNNAVKEKTDSLRTELDAKENKIKADQEQIQQLNKELAKVKTDNENLRKTPIVSQTNDSLRNNSNQNSAAIAASANKTMENGVWVMTASKNEFTYLNNKPSLNGYYVIAGTFFYRDFAKAELKKIKSEGYPSADILYAPSKEFNYIFASFHSSKEDALKQVAKIKADRVKDAWILFIEK